QAGAALLLAPSPPAPSTAGRSHFALSCPSESLQFRKRQLTAVHVHGAELGAALQGRNVLARIEQTLGIKCGLDRLEVQQFVGVELDAHLVDLFATYAMLARNGAADPDAEFEYLAAQLFGAFRLAGLVGVEQYQRVHIAVARVKHVRHRQTIFGGEGGDVPQYLRERAPGNGAVHAVVVRRDPPYGGKRVLTPRPEPLAVGFVRCQPNIICPRST